MSPRFGLSGTRNPRRRQPVQPLFSGGEPEKVKLPVDPDVYVSTQEQGLVVPRFSDCLDVGQTPGMAVAKRSDAERKETTLKKEPLIGQVKLAVADVPLVKVVRVGPSDESLV